MSAPAAFEETSPHPKMSGASSGLGVVVLAFVVSRFTVFSLIFLSRMDVIRGPLWFPGGLEAVLAGGDAAVHLGPARGAEWSASVQQAPGLALTPLFAAIVKAASVLLGHTALAGVVVANSSLLVAGVLLHRLIAVEGGDARTSRNAVMLMMFYPGAFFFSTATPDSMLLALVIGALLAAKNGQWVLATLSTAAAIATSSYGVWMIVPLCLEFLQQRRDQRVAPAAVLLLAIPIACTLVLLALGSSWFGDPLAGFRGGARWERGFASLLELSRTFTSYRVFYEWLFWITIGSAILVIAAGWQLKLRRTYLVFAVVLLVVCLWSHDLQAPRVLGVAFPLFMIMGSFSARQPWSYDVMLVCSLALLSLCTVAAANGFWIT